MAQPDTTFRIDPATPADVPLILALIRELAEYEKLLDAVMATEELIHESLFGDSPHAEAVVARAGDEPVGFALYFHTRSPSRWRAGGRRRRGPGARAAKRRGRPAASRRTRRSFRAS